MIIIIIVVVVAASAVAITSYGTCMRHLALLCLLISSPLNGKQENTAVSYGSAKTQWYLPILLCVPIVTVLAFLAQKSFDCKYSGELFVGDIKGGNKGEHFNLSILHLLASPSMFCGYMRGLEIHLPHLQQGRICLVA